MCLYPKLIKNKKYTSNKKNGGFIPTVFDERTLLVPVGCGNCIECRKQKARSWQVRLLEDIKVNTECVFVTLTFDNHNLNNLLKDVSKTGDIIDNDVCTLAVRRFLERWRWEFKKSVRHWLITELGHNGTERVHLHGLIFSKDIKAIERIWKYGWVYFGSYVNERTVNYIIKYVTKVDLRNRNFKAKILCSKGIGSNYLSSINAERNLFKGKNTKESYKNKQGYELNLPIYYRNKIYSDEEREKLWLNRLDKEIRFVMGEKIDVSKDDTNYYNTLEYYQKLNKSLGYGDDSFDWDKKMYKYKKNWLRYKSIK